EQERDEHECEDLHGELQTVGTRERTRPLRGRRPWISALDDEVDEPAGYDDDLDDLLPVELRARRFTRAALEVRLGGVFRDLDGRAQPAVDLHRDLDLVLDEEARIGHGPGRLRRESGLSHAAPD